MVSRPLDEDAVKQLEHHLTFTAGELSPTLWGRYDLPAYNGGAKEITNFLPLAEGGVTLRRGTKYVRRKDTHGVKTRLYPFIVSEVQAYLIEMVADTIAIYRNGILLSTFTPGYTASAVAEVNISQTTDRAIFCHRSYPPKELRWTGGDSFSFGNFTASGFTYNTHDPDGNPLSAPFSSSGNYPACSSFYAGRLWFAGSYNKPQEVYASRPFSYKDFTTYETVSYTVEQLTAVGTITFTGSLTAGSAIVSTSRDLTGHSPEGKYITGAGIPAGVTIISATPSTITMSTPAAESKASLGYVLTNWYSPGTPEYETVTNTRNIVTDDCAIQFEIASDQSDGIEWMVPARHLVIGTAISEWIIPTTTTPTAPGASLSTRYGSVRAQPRLIGDAVIFLGADGKSLREYRYTEDSGGYTSPDLTFMAKHILAAGVTAIDWQTTPRPAVYAILDDGKLAVLTYDRSAGIAAWSRIETAGAVESIAVIPEDGGDRVYLAVKRGTFTYTETMDNLFEDGPIVADLKIEAVTSYGGFDYLENGTVVYAANGEIYTAIAVEGHIITPHLPDGTAVVAGMPLVGRLSLLRPNVQSQYGSAQGRVKNIARVNANILDSYAFNVGPDFDHSEAVRLDEEPYTGDVDSLFNGRWNKDGWLTVYANSGRPVTILTLVPEVDAGG